MDLKLALVRGDGSIVDLVVTADGSTSIGEVASAIAERDPRSSHVGASRLTIEYRPAGRRGPGARIPPTALLREGRLASGATVALAESRPSPPAIEDAVAVLEVLTGPQRGEIVRLAPGRHSIGRSPKADIAIRDPMISAMHARIDVDHEVELVDLGSANGIVVDGGHVPRVSIPDVQTLVLGGTGVRIRVLRESPARRDRRGPERFTRSPRVEARFEGRSFSAPDPPDEPEREPLPWVAMLAPVLLGVAMALVMSRPAALLVALLAPVTIVGGFLVNRARRERRRRASVAAFETRLAVLDRELGDALAIERSTRRAEAPTAREAVQAALERRPMLWTRRPEHASFLTVRLGTGPAASRSTVEAPTRGELAPELRERLDALLERYRVVPDAPIVERLHDAGGVGIAGDAETAAPVLNAILAQCLGLHAPSEVAIAALVSPRWAARLEWLKWMPHAASSRSPIGERPHLADSVSSASALAAALEALVGERLASGGLERRGALRRDDAATERAGARRPWSGTRALVPALIVLVSVDAPVDQARLVALTEAGPDAGVFPIWIAPTIERLPAACRTVLRVTAAESGTVSFVRLGETVGVRLERLPAADAMRFARDLAAVVDAGAPAKQEGEPPRAVPLTELLGRERVERPAAIAERWHETGSLVRRGPPGDVVAPAAPSPGGLRAAVGATGAGAMHLDLRAHGPHALVGGTTGSGKSEFLQSWVLGMAAEHSPDRVAFLLIDYKGGSAFAECVRLPHCVGLVTDLTPHLVRRALTSLGAELHRRERLFDRKRVADILELERRGDPEAPPALVIVIDELAALAKDAPAFIDGIVDLAQRGRSLGIHLVMATQRPAGVIRDSIRANTTLRVALRMADESDSRDVLGTPDAARLDPAIPGRAIAMTAPGRRETFQAARASGWSMLEPARPDIRITELRFGSEVEWRRPARAGGGEGPSDQARLVDSIRGAFEALALAPPRRPWIDELPRRLDLGPLCTGDDAAIPFGLTDDPAQQRQTTAAFRPDVDGHLALYGASGSGKTVALHTLAVAAARTPRGGPVHVYGLDFAAGGLRLLEPFPHVGAIIDADDAERVARLFRRLATIVEDRAQRFAAVGAASIAAYRSIAAEPGEPRVLLLIDGFPAFREAWELASGREAPYDVLRRVLAVGRRLGVHVALTADRPGSVPGSIASAVQRRVVFRLSEDHGYALLGVPGDILDATSPPGRCVVHGLETHVAVSAAADRPPTAERALAVVEELDAGIPLAEPIGRLPESVPASSIPVGHLDRPVLGVSDETLALTGFEPDGVLLLAGPPRSGRTNALRWLTRAVHDFDPRRTCSYLGSARSVVGRETAFTARAGTVEDVAALAKDLCARIAAGDDARHVIVVEGIADFLHTPADATIVELVKHVKRHGHFLLAENETAGWSGSWPLLADVKHARRGLLLQPDAADGDLLLRTPVARTPRADYPVGRGLHVERGIAIRVQLPHIAGEG